MRTISHIGILRLAATLLAVSGCSQASEPFRLTQGRLSGPEIAVFTYIRAAKVYWPVEGKWAGLNIPVMLRKPCILNPSGQYILSTFWDMTAPKQEQNITFLTDLFEGRSRAIFKNSVLTEAAVWTPDGSRCYFAYVTYKSVTESIYSVPTTHIVCYDLGKNSCSDVASVAGCHISAIRYSEAQHCLAADVTEEIGRTPSRICLIDTRDGKYTLMDEGIFINFDFDKEGNRLFYESLDQHRYMLKVLDMTKRSVEIIHRGDGMWPFYPAWTPDNSRAALMWGQRPALFDVKTKALTKIEWFSKGWNVDGLCHQLVWSDSGRYLAGYWQPMSPSRILFVADMERREIAQLHSAEHPFPIRIIEDPATVSRLKEAWWVKESLKDPSGGNEPKSIMEK
jgi:hypothetical protein